jgi:hypothetical protein
MNRKMNLNLHRGGLNAGIAYFSGSIAIKRGAAGKGCRFGLRDGRGRSLPVQTGVLARWPDGSARWVHVEFSCSGGGVSEGGYQLVWGEKESGVTASERVKVKKGERMGLESGGVRVVACRAGEEGAILSLGGWKLDWVVADGRGKRFKARVEEVAIERGSGPLRGTLALAGSFVDGQNGRLFGWRLRASVYAGVSRVKLEPMITVDPAAGVMTRIREMKLVISALDGGEIQTRVGRRMQVDDEQVLEGGKLKAERSAGHVTFAAGEARATLALRDFRQRWPKALGVGKESAEVELFPRFEAGRYGHMEPWYKYQYLFDGGCYQLKTGQARRWEMWVDLNGGDGESLMQGVDEPPVLLADPAEAMATGVWGHAVAGGVDEEYDKWVAGLFESFCASQREQRDYGEMNWGDWFGERYVNWGNNEYDTSYELYFQAARLNNAAMHRMADAAARHASEVDVVHFTNAELNESYGPAPEGFPPRPGMMHEHCVGHVGGFYSEEKVRRLFVSFGVGKSKRPYLCLDPFNLGHIWTRGIAQHYFLTGDPWSKKIATLMGDSLARLTEDGEYSYFSNRDHSGRVAGWTLEALSGAYEIGYDKRYLRAMRHIVDLNLAEQNAHSGGWHYSLPWGHCFCPGVKHVGEAAFLTAIRINGLNRYFELTGDKLLPEAIRRAVTHMNNDTWKEEWADWRYTSCPASKMSNRHGDILKAVAASVLLTGDDEQRRVLRKAWEATKASRASGKPPGEEGKFFTTRLVGSAQVVKAVRMGEGK